MQHSRISVGAWKDDVLNRSLDADYIVNFLLGRIAERHQAGKPRSFVLNVDAGWGGGKSYFLTNLASSLRTMKYLVAEVNAWQDDYADDPLLSVMSAIDATMKPLLPKTDAIKDGWRVVQKNGAAIALAAGRAAATQGLKRVFGSGLEAIETAIGATAGDAGQEALNGSTSEVARILDRASEQLLSTFESTKHSIALFRRNLAALLSNIGPDSGRTPLFVLVDELDRCRPTYAITMLERIKHLFSIDDVVFVVATDTAQLSHAVGAVYGHTFDGRAYLRRFFDRTYYFDKPDAKSFVAARLASEGPVEDELHLPTGASLSVTMADAFSSVGLQLRDMEQCLDVVRSIVTVWSYPTPIELSVLLPLVIGNHIGLTPAINDDFAAQLAERMPHEWLIVDHTARNSKRRDHPFTRLFAAFYGASHPLLQNANADMDSGTADHIRYATLRYIEEAQQLSRVNRMTAETTSIISQYPRLVREAGRILQAPA